MYGASEDDVWRVISMARDLDVEQVEQVILRHTLRRPDALNSTMFEIFTCSSLDFHVRSIAR